MKTKYENVISLGFFCSVAMELDRIHRRKASFPFDWCISRFPEVINMIDNHFTDFLNYDQMEQNKVDLSHYRNAYGIEFYHDFNAFDPLSEQFYKVKKKYNRRIKRFYKAIKKPTLFIRYVEDGTEIDYIEQNINNIRSLFKKGNINNDILFISNKENTLHLGNDKGCYYVSKDEGDTVARQFLDDNKELAEFLAQSLPERKKGVRFYIRRITKKLTSLISCFQKSQEKNSQPVYIHNRQY